MQWTHHIARQQQQLLNQAPLGNCLRENLVLAIMSLLNQPQSLTPLEWLMPRSYIQQIFFSPSCDPRIEQILRSGTIGTVKDVPHLACSTISRETQRDPSTCANQITHRRSCSLAETFDDSRLLRAKVQAVRSIDFEWA